MNSFRILSLLLFFEVVVVVNLSYTYTLQYHRAHHIEKENNPQTTKDSSRLSFSLFSIPNFKFSLRVGDSSSNLDHFIQCLPNHYNKSSKPISQAIYTRDNPSFTSVFESYIRNLRFKPTPATCTRTPLAIIAAMDESHVQATVICAKSEGLQIRIRSGGHDYEGLSYTSDQPFVLLDMFNLRAIDIELPNERARVQTGATLGELYHKIAQHSKVHAFPGGICPSVGTGGHFGGAGYGPLMRKYGLSVDNIDDARIVDVNGNILDRKSMGEDLFWAIRGGGASSFGVVLSWTIKLVLVPKRMTVFTVEKTLEHEGTTDLVYRWQQVAPTLPKEVFLRLQPAVKTIRKGKKTISFSIIGSYLGRAQTLIPLMNERFPELGLQKQNCTEMSWIESTVFWWGRPSETLSLDDILLERIPKERPFFVGKSDYVKQPISKMGLKFLWKKMLEMDTILLQWTPYGGRMSEISESETPFPRRNEYIYQIQYYINWNDANASNRHIESARMLYSAMTPYVSQSPRQTFLNYRDLDIGTNRNGGNSSVFGTMYFKDNYQRLVHVKTMVDPDNFFRNEQSIPPLQA